MDEQAAVRNFKDFLTVYNTFTEKCFNHCVSNLNYRMLTPEEETCVDKCASKLINVNHRVIGTYMEVSPLTKMMASAEEQAQMAAQAEQLQQQQQPEVGQLPETGAATEQILQPPLQTDTVTEQILQPPPQADTVTDAVTEQIVEQPQSQQFVNAENVTELKTENSVIPISSDTNVSMVASNTSEATQNES